MNLQAMHQINYAHNIGDYELVNDLLHRFLKDLDPTDLPDGALTAYYELFPDPSNEITDDEIDDILALAGINNNPEWEGEGPTLRHCLEVAKEEGYAVPEFPVDVESREALFGYSRPLVNYPQNFKDFCSWIQPLGINLPDTITKNLFLLIRKTYPLAAANTGKPMTLSLAAARKDTLHL